MTYREVNPEVIFTRELMRIDKKIINHMGRSNSDLAGFIQLETLCMLSWAEDG